jgi:hypothetical protein
MEAKSNKNRESFELHNHPWEMQLAYKFRISACTGMSYAVLNLLD